MFVCSMLCFVGSGIFFAFAKLGPSKWPVTAIFVTYLVVLTRRWLIISGRFAINASALVTGEVRFQAPRLNLEKRKADCHSAAGQPRPSWCL